MITYNFFIIFIYYSFGAHILSTRAYRQVKTFGPILHLYEFFQKFSGLQKSLKFRQGPNSTYSSMRKKTFGGQKKGSFLIFEPHLMNNLTWMILTSLQPSILQSGLRPPSSTSLNT